MNRVKKLMIFGLILFNFSCAIVAQEDYKQSNYYKSLTKINQLNYAIEERDVDTIAELLKEVDVNSQDENGRTPLFNAIPDGELAIVKLLVESGADVNAQNDSGTTSLWEAHASLIESIAMIYADGLEEAISEDFFMEYIFIAQYLVDSGADITLSYTLETAHGSMTMMLLEIVAFEESGILDLLETNCDLSERDENLCNEMIKYIHKFQAILQA